MHDGSSSASKTEVRKTNCRARLLSSGCFTSQFVPRRPSGIPEEDVRSAMVPYLLKHRSYLRKVLKEKEEENRKVAESVLAGRDRIAELQQLIQARKRAWQVKIKNKQIKAPSLCSISLKETVFCGLTSKWLHCI